MRYRRLAYRYTVLLHAHGLPSFSQASPLAARSATFAEPHWRPETDVVDTPDGLVITIALAGVDPEDVDVLLFEDALVVEGRRWLPCHEAGVYRAAEIPQGPFRVAVALLEPVDVDRVDVASERGLLRLTVRRLVG